MPPAEDCTAALLAAGFDAADVTAAMTAAKGNGMAALHSLLDAVGPRRPQALAAAREAVAAAAGGDVNLPDATLAALLAAARTDEVAQAGGQPNPKP